MHAVNQTIMAIRLGAAVIITSVTTRLDQGRGGESYGYQNGDVMVDRVLSKIDDIYIYIGEWFIDTSLLYFISIAIRSHYYYYY